MKKIKAFLFICLSLAITNAFSQTSSLPVLETGADMPDEWIDKDTRHRVKRISRMDGSSLSFYFHNSPFIGNSMVFYNSQKTDLTGVSKQETYSTSAKNKQLYIVDLATLKTEQLTYQASAMNGEILDKKNGIVYYQIKDSVFATEIKSKKTSLVYVFPDDFKATITTVNADGTLLGGARSSDEEKELFKQNPGKSSYFNIIYEAKLPRTLFTVHTSTKKLDKLFTDSAWLNHVQFSTTDPNLLMFCHEGPWHKVDRIWTMNITNKQPRLMHKRTMDMEIAGHEWPSADGKTIWFDLQLPRGKTFYVAGVDLATGIERRYSLERNEWSIHFNATSNERMFCGDGADSGQVAKAPDAMWIYLFKPDGDKFISEKLVNMKKHVYRLEPNVHFSPDEKWVIFRANFEGIENIYAVEIAKTD